MPTQWNQLRNDGTLRSRAIKRESPLKILDCRERRSEAEMRNIENRHRRVLGPNFDVGSLEGNLGVAEKLARRACICRSNALNHECCQSIPFMI